MKILRGETSSSKQTGHSGAVNFKLESRRFKPSTFLSTFTLLLTSLRHSCSRSAFSFSR